LISSYIDVCIFRKAAVERESSRLMQDFKEATISEIIILISSENQDSCEASVFLRSDIFREIVLREDETIDIMLTG